MAKKGLDAEALKKHHFWIILGLFAALWIAAAVMAKVTAGVAKKNAWKEAKDKIDGALKAGPKTEAYQKPWSDHGQKFSNHKDVIWKDAWVVQKDMYGWPDNMRRDAVPLYPDDYFAPKNRDGTVNITLDQNNRNAFKRDWYPTQFPPLLNYCDPAEFSGGFYSVFPMQQWDARGTPTREEIWLAQEDFWVRREMMFMIRNAMDSMAWLKDVTPKEEKAKELERAKKKEKPADGIEYKRVFRNSNWELTLLFERDEAGRGHVVSDKSTIKNVNANGRTLMLAHPKTTRGLPFQLFQGINGRTAAPLEIAGEPLAGELSTPLKKKYRISPVNLNVNLDDPRNELYVTQALAWENSPIRRIDALMLGLHSHRTVTAALKINEDMKKLDPDPEGDAAAAPADGGGMMGGGMSPGGATGSADSGRMPGMAGGRSAGPADGTRINRIDRARYIQVTPQCRHLPVAMRLIVEQAHVHDILTAVANSRLRIQITQVSLTHAPEAKRGVLGSAAAGPGGLAGGRPLGGVAGMPGGEAGSSPDGGSEEGGRGPGGRAPGPMMGGSMGGMGSMGSMGYPSRPGMSGFGGGDGGYGMPSMSPGVADKTATFYDTANLVELSIYGIAALYEPFPPRPKTDAAAPPAGSAATTTK